MKKKTYRVGGQNPPQEKPKAKVYGPPKPPGYKYPTEEEREEAAGEKAYIKLKDEVDREVARMRKDGATEEQINRYANKVLSTFGRR